MAAESLAGALDAEVDVAVIADMAEGHLFIPKRLILSAN